PAELARGRGEGQGTRRATATTKRPPGLRAGSGPAYGVVGRPRSSPARPAERGGRGADRHAPDRPAGRVPDRGGHLAVALSLRPGRGVAASWPERPPGPARRPGSGRPGRRAPW